MLLTRKPKTDVNSHIKGINSLIMLIELFVVASHASCIAPLVASYHVYHALLSHDIA